MTLNNLTNIILELNAALDTGKYDNIPMLEASQHIEAGDVIPWLQSRVPDADFSALTAEVAHEYQAALANLYGGCVGDERRRWGVKRRALCLLVAWTNELVQRRCWQGA